MSARTVTCCQHDADVHEHYRRGTDCSLCVCRRLRTRRVPRHGGPLWTLRFLAGLARQIR